MMSNISKFDRVKVCLQKNKRFVLTLLTFCLLFLGTGSLAQLNDAIQPQHQKALETISSLIASQQWDHADQMLREYGYKPVNEEIWRKLPVIRKLEAGYLAA